MTLDDEALEFVMSFYKMSLTDAKLYYQDEIEAYKRLLTRFNDETFSSRYGDNNQQ